jgi:plastocyanin
MRRGIIDAFVIAAMVLSGAVQAQQSDYKVEKTIGLFKRDGKLTFIERGKATVEPIIIIVGNRVRWENNDDKPHTVVSTLTIDGKPLFSTGVINPGEYEDVLFDINLYERAGGKPANVISLRYRSDEQQDEGGELQLLSAAKR